MSLSFLRYSQFMFLSALWIHSYQILSTRRRSRRRGNHLPPESKGKNGAIWGRFPHKIERDRPFPPRPPTTYLNKKRQEPHKIEKQRPPPLLRPFEGQYAFSKDIAVRLLYDTRLHDTIPVLACTDEIKSEPRDIIRDDGVILHHTFWPRTIIL